MPTPSGGEYLKVPCQLGVSNQRLAIRPKERSWGVRSLQVPTYDTSPVTPVLHI